MAQEDHFAFRYDFSCLSRGRLRAYHRMVEEFERLHSDEEARELSDEELELMAAAGEKSPTPPIPSTTPFSGKQ